VSVGYLLVRLVTGQDIRGVGSGSIGATNVARVLGNKGFFVVYILDFLKGLIPCAVAGWVVAHPWPKPAPLVVVLCGMLAVVGHIWPVYLRFRGGKGVATSCGVCVYLFPLPFLLGLAVWGLVAAVWRYVSLASIVATVFLSSYMWWLYYDRLDEAGYTLGFATLAAAMILFRHRSNLARLLRGAEHKIGQRIKASPPATQQPPTAGKA
jgi:glycerol-3-phosphate acyltransferase PlsY